MIPVVDLNQVHVAWVQIKGFDFLLYGFMVYSDQDAPLVEFMQKQSGLAELDQLSGDDCAIFVIESPSRKWIEYARRHDHAWWRLFGRNMNLSSDTAKVAPESLRVAEVVESLVRNRESVLVCVGPETEPKTLRQILEPNYGTLYDRNEAWAVVHHFGLSPQDVPCMIFFRDLDKGDFDVVCLRDITSPHQATWSFRDFFSGADFQRLIHDARRYA